MSLQIARSNWKKIVLYSMVISVSLTVILLAVTFHYISSDIRAICKEAQKEYEGDAVEALIAYLGSTHHTYKEKNKARAQPCMNIITNNRYFRD